MSALVIVEISINDHKEYDEYKKLTPASVAAYDGKFVVRGGRTDTLEGDWHPERLVVLEFPSMDRAHEWWASAEYAKAKAIRQKVAHTKMIIVEGV